LILHGNYPDVVSTLLSGRGYRFATVSTIGTMDQGELKAADLAENPSS